jgi:hypothetical protein
MAIDFLISASFGHNGTLWYRMSDFLFSTYPHLELPTVQLLKRGNFLSQDDLRTQILEFIDYFNRTMAKPFRWTYRGKVLAA